ncbi:hypothetical protein jhhlp_007832 [Lomentospora prolificans]|uniref:Deacetylase sirtuin-type domain-containing protein n=1 Tax=Lomentospora prolificans TaxID=41688 RepID=A0A2N3N0N6_9PEZI|nr:hypothetical protein jhhlp_007832 [Lomentospora prolificans]
MPTTHVRPEDGEALQIIANAVVKAKKVVVVTGAGISTNSGIPDFRSENGLYQLIQAQYEAAARLAAQPQVLSLGSRTSSSREDASNCEEFPTDRARKRRKLSPTEREDSGSSPRVAEGDKPRRRGRPRKSTRLSEEDAVEPKSEDSIIVKQEASESQDTSSGNTSGQGTPFEQDEEPELPQDNPPDSPSFQLAQEALDQSRRSGRANSLPPEFQSPPRLKPQPSVPQSSPPHYSERDFPFTRQSRPASHSLDTRQDSAVEDFRARWASWATSSHDLLSSPPLRPLSAFPATPTHTSALRTPINPQHRRVLASLAAESSPLSDPPLFCSSSPLSSPPPDLFDPLEESPTSPRGSAFGSSTSPSETDETPPLSTLITSSQSSTLSAKLPIPNIKGRDLFDASIWSCPIRTSVFYTFATTLRQKAREVSPTTSHHFISHLRDRGKLVRCYTQNIDRIEEKVGLTTALDRGPGQKSRFSNRRSTLSRLSSTLSKEASTLSEDGHTSVGNASTGAEQTIGEGDQSSKASEDGQNDQRGGGPERQVDDCAEYDRKDSGAEDHTDSGNGSGQTSSQVSVTTDNSSRECPEPASGQETAMNSRDGSQEIPATSSQGSQFQAPGKGAGPPGFHHSPPSSGVECVLLHGSLESLRCFLCRKLCQWDGDNRENETLSGRQPECPHCAGATAARQERGKRALGVGKLRPDVVLYGEEHPNAHLISPVVTHDLGIGPDLLLILGTSLKVHGLKVMVRQFAKAVHTKGGKVVFINFTKPPESIWGDVIDYWIQWDCDAWVDNLKERVPLLWLPPGTTLPEPPKKRKRESTGEKKKPTKKSSLKKEKTGEITSNSQNSVDGAMVGDTSVIDSITASVSEGKPMGAPVAKPKGSASDLDVTADAPEKSAPKEGTKPAQAPEKSAANWSKNIKEDKANGAYLTWKIMDNLRRLSGRSAPPPMELPSLLATRAAAATAAKIKRNEAARARRQRKSAPAALTRPEPSNGEGVTMQAQDISTPQIPDPAVSRSSPPTAISFETPLPRPQPQQDSILAAVKSNPRRRKRKTIDGEEVVLPCVNSRGSANHRQGTPLGRITKPFQPKGKENGRLWVSTTPIPIPCVPHSARETLMGSPQYPQSAHSMSLPQLGGGYPESLALPPLRQPISPTDQHSSPFPKPQPIEPSSSPRGPLTAISANIRSSWGDLRRNPFFFADPSVRWSGPPWGVGDARGGAKRY